MAVCWFAAIAVAVTGRERVLDACKRRTEERTTRERLWVGCMSEID